MISLHASHDSLPWFDEGCVASSPPLWSASTVLIIQPHKPKTSLSLSVCSFFLPTAPPSPPIRGRQPAPCPVPNQPITWHRTTNHPPMAASRPWGQDQSGAGSLEAVANEWSPRGGNKPLRTNRFIQPEFSSPPRNQIATPLHQAQLPEKASWNPKPTKATYLSLSLSSHPTGYQNIYLPTI